MGSIFQLGDTDVFHRVRGGIRLRAPQKEIDMEACTTGQTLCWRCQRATNAPGRGCSWSRRADPEPVEGWEARETTLKGSDYYHGKNYTTIIQSYVIRACPLFLPDGKGEPPRIYRKWIVEVDGEWLTTQETRERLGIDRHEIYKLIERGKLNARQVEQMS